MKQPSRATCPIQKQVVSTALSPFVKTGGRGSVCHENFSVLSHRIFLSSNKEQGTFVSLDFNKERLVYFLEHLSSNVIQFQQFTSHVTEITLYLVMRIVNVKAYISNYILFPIHYIHFHCLGQKNPSNLYNSDNCTDEDLRHVFLVCLCIIGQQVRNGSVFVNQQQISDDSVPVEFFHVVQERSARWSIVLQSFGRLGWCLSQCWGDFTCRKHFLIEAFTVLLKSQLSRRARTVNTCDITDIDMKSAQMKASVLSVV